MATTKERLYKWVDTLTHPQLAELSNALAKIEPYSYDSDVKRSLVKVINRLTVLQDYVLSVAEGEEDTTEQELNTLFRLMTSKSNGGGMSVSQDITTILPPAASDNGVELYINGASYSSVSPTVLYPFKTYDFIAKYPAGAKLITFNLDGITISEESDEIHIDNFFLRTANDVTKTITVTVLTNEDTTVTATFTLTINQD